jgi:RNA-directed DNA polymerase
MAVFPRYHGPPLIEQVCTVENLTNAWRRVRSNVKVTRRYRSAGIDRMTLDDFAAD